MRGRRRAANLYDDYGLGECDLPCRGKEGAGVADRLHVDDNAARAWIVAKVGNEVAPADIEHRSD